MRRFCFSESVFCELCKQFHRRVKLRKCPSGSAVGAQQLSTALHPHATRTRDIFAQCYRDAARAYDANIAARRIKPRGMRYPTRAQSAADLFKQQRRCTVTVAQRYYFVGILLKCRSVDVSTHTERTDSHLRADD